MMLDEHKDMFEEWLKTKKSIGVSVVNIDLSDFPDFEELKGSHE